MRGALNSCPGERVSDPNHLPRSEHTSRSQAKLYFPAGEGLNHSIGSPKMARGEEMSPQHFLCGGRSRISDSGCFHPISSWLLHRHLVPLVPLWGLLRASVPWGKAGAGAQCGDGAPSALRPSPAHPHLSCLQASQSTVVTSSGNRPVT